MARANLGSGGSKSGGGSGGKSLSSEHIKLIVAGVVLLAGLVLILYNLNIIGPDPATKPLPPQPVDANLTPEEKQQMQKFQEEKQEYLKIHPPSGS